MLSHIHKFFSAIFFTSIIISIPVVFIDQILNLLHGEYLILDRFITIYLDNLLIAGIATLFLFSIIYDYLTVEAKGSKIFDDNKNLKWIDIIEANDDTSKD